jgi:hypothetical protein
MTISTKRFLTLLAALAAATVLAAGCGDDNGGGGGGGKTSDSGGPLQNAPGNDSGADDTPDTKSEAIDKCYEEADKLEGQAKDTARAGCKAADTGDTDQLKQEAKKQCLESTKQIPDEPARQQAVDACNKLAD